MKSNLITAVIAGALGAVVGGGLLWKSEPAYAQTQPQGIPDGKGGVMIVGTAGDMQGVNNLIYVVHQRKMGEKELGVMRGFFKDFPEERTTLTVYRVGTAGGAGGIGPQGTSLGKLLIQRDITIEKMLPAGDQATMDSQEWVKAEWEKQLKRIK